jgi:hydrogenase expression/formation protein HypE
LNALVDAMTSAGEVHTLRDPTRGGLGTSLCEIAASSSVGIEIDANSVPVREDVKAACETLGMDPLFVANEGKLVAMVAPASADAVLQAMRSISQGRDARIIGRVVAAHPKMAILKTEIGGSRVLDLPFVEQLPRIC